MKRVFAFALVATMSAQSAFATDYSVLSNLEDNLAGILRKSEGRKNIAQMKTTANERNVDVEIAFQNYLIAKKKVSVARADFNPLRTGHLLGIALGWNYLWAPIVADAILSIPMKIHNVNESQYLKQAASYNLADAREALNNEMAHLYFDILSHEALMRSIDEEIKILNFYEKRLAERQASVERREDVRASILNLQKERTQFYDLYLKELSAIRTLLRMDDTQKFDLAQVEQELNSSITYGLEMKKLQEFALANSNKYKVSVNLHRASQANVKSVKWSILSSEGLNFQYKKKVKIAKNEERIAALQRESTELGVKNQVKLQLEKLNSSLKIFANYDQVSDDSLNFFEDQYEMLEAGNGSEDAAITSSIVAIRDFRSKIISHYSTWSSLDDFSDAANISFKVGDQNILSELESKPLYFVAKEDFDVSKASNGQGSIMLSLKNDKDHAVESVEYRFADNKLPAQKIEGDRRFALMLDKAPADLAGTAIVRFANGYEIDLKF